MYTTWFLFIAFLSWILHAWGDKILEWIPLLQKSCDEADCFGVLGIYRVSFTLAMFHLALGLITIGVRSKGDVRVSIQDGWWPVKFILFAGVLVGSFFIPNVFFEYYGWIALGASGLFILVQLVILVDFAHSWAENWIEKRDDFIEEGMNRWMVALLVASIILYCFSIAATIVMYIFFSSCQMNLAFISVNLVLCIVMTITSLHPKVQEHSESSGILQASIISAYCTYLAWSSLMSEPVDFRPDGLKCNPWASDVGTSASSNITVIIGAVITIIALVYTTIRVAISVGNNDLESQPLTKEEKEIESEMDKEEDVKSVNKDDPVEYSFVNFTLSSFWVQCILLC